MAYQNPGMSAQNYPRPSFDDDVGVGVGGGDSGVYDKGEQELLKVIIDVSDVLDDFEHRVLRGEIKLKNSRTGEEHWEPMPGGIPIINELGIRELMSRIVGRVTKLARLTYKTDEEIYKDLFYFDMSIVELIAKRSDVWEMNMEVAKSIKDSAVELVWDTVSSSRDGFTSINLRSQYSRSDVSRVEPQEAKGRTFLGIRLGKK